MIKMKPTREEMEKKIGKREPLPGEGKPRGANWDTKKEPYKPSSPGSLGDPLGLKKNLRERTEGYAKGGSVRGCGVASKGKNKAKMY
jgi:hypothetical protein